MKKFLLTIAAMMFCASTISAAPAQNTAGGGASAKKTATKTTTKQTAKKATTQKTTQTTTQETSAKAEQAQEDEERQEQYGLMPSELDLVNHNVFHADAAAIKGARDTESALRYLPFVTIVNTAGFGQSFDLRGQGRLASNGVKLYINGVATNPVDTYNSPAPINTVIPSLIQEVAVYPGGGAVTYGSGTKGGTINIITSKRQIPYFLVGGGYINTMATKGHSFNVFAQAAESFGERVKMNAGLAYNQMGGPRENDSLFGGQATAGITYDIGWGNILNFDLDLYYGKNKTTPYNSLINESVLSDMMLNLTPNTGQNGLSEANRYLCLGVRGPNVPADIACPYNLYDFEPNKENRADAGNGEINTSHIRVTGKLGWQLEATQKLQFNVDAFYNLNYTKYNTYQMNLPYFVLGYVDLQTGERGYNWFLPRPRSDGSIPIYSGDGQRADWHYFDQSGSTFNDNKFGANANMTLQHDNGVFILGLSSHYEMSNKKQNSYLRQAITDGASFGANQNSADFSTLIADVRNKTDISTITSAIFILENYRFNKNFSLMAGLRYEMKNYDVKITDDFSGRKLEITDPSTIGSSIVEATPRSVSDDFRKNFDNFTFELSPVFRYSDTGLVYARAEIGYVAPPAWAMLQRIGVVEGAKSPEDGYKNSNDFDKLNFNFIFNDTHLESETYWTAELGWKELLGSKDIPLGFTDLTLNMMLFSANLFYTDSKNEFFFTGDTWSGMHFDNYDRSRRMGAELAFEQYIFGGAVGFNESFTYLKAQQKTSGGGWKTIPYTYDYKATLGANFNVAAWVEIVDVAVNIWIQNSFYGNQHIYNTDIMVDLDLDNNNKLTFDLIENSNKKLKSYIVSDFGVSFGFYKNTTIVTTGIKNLFDTFYYDYYNNDRSAVVNENRYIVGRGRTVFVEAQYRY